MTTIFRTALCVAVLLVPMTAGAQSGIPPFCGEPTETLRWHVPKVEHYDDDTLKNFCETTILVTNLDRAWAVVQVDFQRGMDTQCLQDEIPPGGSLTFGTSPMQPIQSSFFAGGIWSRPGNTVGRANVHSNQRGVQVAVHLVCREAPFGVPAELTGMTELPAYRIIR